MAKKSMTPSERREAILRFSVREDRTRLTTWHLNLAFQSGL